MKKFNLIIFLIFSLLIFSGCLKSDLKIFLKKNGSGTVEVSQMISEEILGLLGSFGQNSSQNTNDNPYSEEEFKKNISELGEGVELVSYKPLASNGFIGGQGTYTFKDINKLKIGVVLSNYFSAKDSASETLMDLSSGSSSSESKNKDKLTTFTFKQTGNSSILTINNPPTTESDNSTEEADQNSEMFKNILKGLTITFKIEVDGRIINTNSKKINKSECTLIDLNFDKVLENEQVFNELMKLKEEDAIKKLNTVQGIFIEEQNPITLEFR